MKTHRIYNSSLLIAFVLVLAGCEQVESPSVVVLPDRRMVAAQRLSDDTDEFGPRIVELKVPVTSPQLRLFCAKEAASSPTTGPAAVAGSTCR